MTSETRVVLVTGASSGIGQATAVLFARHGYDVVVNYVRREEGVRQAARAVEEAGQRALITRCDVADESAVQAMVQACQEKFGRLDALVNTAGITTRQSPRDLDGTAMEEWDRIFAVNVKGTFLVTRAAAPMLRESRGSVVNMASMAGIRPTDAHPHAYAASKAAVVSLTKTLAAALGPEVRVNAVAPGWVLGAWMQEQLGDNYERLNERRARYTPLKRVATNEDVAEVVLTIVEHLHFMTGQVFSVDGGYSIVT